MTQRKDREFRNLTVGLSRLPRYFRVNPDSIEMGCAWQDMIIAAALLSRTCLMINHVTQKEYDFPAATLKAVVRKFDPKGRVFVIFILEGAAGEVLRLRRFKYCDGQLYVHPRERKEQLTKLLDIYREAKEKAETIQRQV